ncbi:MAG: hypothetical protein ACOYMS_00055 [Terrimicrobiaceae bacterium]
MDLQIGKSWYHTPAESILRRLTTESRPDWILDDVVADSRKGILSFLLLAQNMVVALLLETSW